MKFVDRDESRRLEAGLRRQIAESGGPKLIAYYKSTARNYAPAAHLSAGAAGAFAEASLFFQFAVAGDGWHETQAADQRWHRYREWRTEHNEARRLDEAPGHCFAADEAELLSQSIEFALELGWDALLSVKPGRQLLFLSHDDRLELYRGFGGRVLIRDLAELGYWRQA